jgi:hypothetical protein
MSGSVERGGVGRSGPGCATVGQDDSDACQWCWRPRPRLGVRPQRRRSLGRAIRARTRFGRRRAGRFAWCDRGCWYLLPFILRPAVARHPPAVSGPCRHALSEHSCDVGTMIESLGPPRFARCVPEIGLSCKDNHRPSSSLQAVQDVLVASYHCMHLRGGPPADSVRSSFSGLESIQDMWSPMCARIPPKSSL